MHSFIINAYSFFIECLGCVSARINNRTKQVITGLMISMLCFLGIIKHLKASLKEAIHYEDIPAIYIGALILLVLLLVTADKYTDHKKIIMNRLCLYGWLMCFIAIFVMSFINPVRPGYFVWSIVSLFVSIPFVIIYAERDDFSLLCSLLARIMTAATGCFVIFNLLLVPFIKAPDLLGYAGLMENPNGNGMVCTGLYAACFFLLLTEERGTLVYAVIAGFCISISNASDCRTAQLAIALETIVGMGYSLRCWKKNEKTPNAKKAAIACIVFVITVLAGTIILEKIGRMDLNAYAFDDPGAIASAAESGELLNTIDSASSGRVHIWKAFISEATFWGNGSPQEPVIPGEDASFYAHNNAIQILYNSGVPAFTGYVFFLISGIAFVIRCIRGKNGYKKEHLLVIMAFTGYFVEAMLEILMYPMCHMPAILLNLCMMPIFIRNSNGPDQTALTTGDQL